MPKITGFTMVDTGGYPVLCDAHGNNAAFRCPGCGGPILFDYHDKNQRGASAENPSVCVACKARYVIDTDEPKSRLTVRRMLS